MSRPTKGEEPDEEKVGQDFDREREHEIPPPKSLCEFLLLSRLPLLLRLCVVAVLLLCFASLCLTLCVSE